MTDSWSDIEVELIVADYFAMLVDELSGKQLNKTINRNNLKKMLPKRSEGSIEFKHQNISAILLQLGLPYIQGYKPRGNYQQILKTIVISHLKQKGIDLQNKFEAFAANADVDAGKVEFQKMTVEPPPIQELTLAEPEITYNESPIKINYLQREQANHQLGKNGESLALEYEKWRLKNLKLEKFVEKIKWISVEDDSAGFDILSKNNDGSDRFIEVKTTQLGIDTPFYFSKNEYRFSRKENKNYHLYRLFNFKTKPKIFTLNGSFDTICKIEPVQFKGYF